MADLCVFGFYWFIYCNTTFLKYIFVWSYSIQRINL